jgi:hypothetical protein
MAITNHRGLIVWLLLAAVVLGGEKLSRSFTDNVVQGEKFIVAGDRSKYDNPNPGEWDLGRNAPH